MPGTLPAMRSRRLGPVPCASRLRAVISIAIALLLDRGNLFNEKGAHRFLGVDPQNRFGEQAGHRQLPDFLALAGPLPPPDGVGYPPLLPRRGGGAAPPPAPAHPGRAGG